MLQSITEQKDHHNIMSARGKATHESGRLASAIMVSAAVSCVQRRKQFLVEQFSVHGAFSGPQSKKKNSSGSGNGGRADPKRGGQGNAMRIVKDCEFQLCPGEN